MSWYGCHPRYSKDQIKALLPPAACKHCVYWFRTVIGSSPDGWHQEYPKCPRCGIPQWELLAKLNERLLEKPVPARQAASSRVHEPLFKRVRDSVRAIWKSPYINQRSRTGEAASALQKWLNFYESLNHDVKMRAARALLARHDIPLCVLLDILDSLSRKGLGAATKKVLLERRDVGLLDEMIARLDSRDDFLREVACDVLGRSGNPAATQHVLRMMDDSHIMVRRAAGFALAHLKDPSAIPELKRQFSRRRNDDVNVVWALRSALHALGVETDTP